MKTDGDARRSGPPARAARLLRVEVVTDLERLDAVGDAWDRLDRRSPPETIYHTRRFLMPWLDYVRHLRALSVRLVWENEELIGVAPLVQDLVRVGPIRLRRLALATQGGYSPSLDLRLDENRAAEALAALVYRGADWSLLSMRHLSGSSAALRWLADVAASRGLTQSVEPARRESFLWLEGTWQDYLESLARKHRKELRRTLNAAEAMTDWRFVHEWVEEDSAPTAFAAFEDTLRRSWKRGQALDPAFSSLLKRLFLEFSRTRSLLVSRLQGPDAWGAAAMMLRYGNRLFGFITAYDEACPVRGAGTVLLARDIEHAYTSGLSIFDFSTAEAHFSRWNPSHRNTFDVRLTHRSALGAAVRLGLRLQRHRSARSESREAGSARRRASGPDTGAGPREPGR